jgi:hypothetical protein
MRNRWLVVAVVASLCLNVAVVGSYFLHRVRHGGFHRFPARGLTPEVRERLRKARAEALPEFAALAEKVEATDSLLWAEMRSDSPDSARVESLCQDLGQTHGKMRAMVFRQMHRELQLMPAPARAEYLQNMMMMRMRPGFGPGRGMGGHMDHGHGMGQPPVGEPPPGLPPPEPPPESGN